MKDLKTVLLTGIRDSKLSQAQAKQALTRIEELVSGLKFEMRLFSSPGDRDKTKDLREAPPDFFTKDLDDALIAGEIDLAIHSAKDLPETLDERIDFFHLPWKEDPRDVAILPKDKPDVEIKRIGVSSERRAEYCRKFYPNAELLPVRGNIEQRVAQLDAGKFDMLIMAAAGLKRLGLKKRINDYIDLTDLPVPEAQGVLAVTFRKNDARMTQIRKLFVKPVIIAGAGIGDKENVTIAVKNAMRNCEVCLYDALIPEGITNYLNNSCKRVPVGKRSGIYSMKQDEISNLIAEYARKGFRTLRLKGGDPTLFGRLSEETELLDALQLPFKVLPGISTISATAASTGLLPTRRGKARGFITATVRKAASSNGEWFTTDELKQNFTKMLFMSISQADLVFSSLLEDGNSPETPAAVIFNAGTDTEEILTGTISTLGKKIKKLSTTAPGIIVAGPTADSKYLFKNHALLADCKVMLTSSEKIAEKAATAVKEYGGIPLKMPLIKLELLHDKINELFKKIHKYDYIIIPSPNIAELFISALNEYKFDIRKLPKIAVSGPGTESVLNQYSLYPEIVPKKSFGTDGILDEFNSVENLTNIKICRLVSNKAKSKLSDKLKNTGALVEDAQLYSNTFIKYESPLNADAVIFSSPSTVEAFEFNFSNQKNDNTTAVAIGIPTYDALLNSQLEFLNIIKSEVQDISGTVLTLAAQKLTEALNEL